MTSTLLSRQVSGHGIQNLGMFLPLEFWIDFMHFFYERTYSLNWRLVKCF